MLVSATIPYWVMVVIGGLQTASPCSIAALLLLWNVSSSHDEISNQIGEGSEEGISTHWISADGGEQFFKTHTNYTLR